MALGDSVAALLETYSNCLKLLKAFNRGNAGNDSLGESQLLRSSIKSDRAKVRRAYSSRRSVAGKSFEKGDRESQSPFKMVLVEMLTCLPRTSQVCPAPSAQALEDGHCQHSQLHPDSQSSSRLQLACVFVASVPDRHDPCLRPALGSVIERFVRELRCVFVVQVEQA